METSIKKNIRILILSKYCEKGFATTSTCKNIFPSDFDVNSALFHVNLRIRSFLIRFEFDFAKIRNYYATSIHTRTLILQP